jgi:sterol desaturase/sphingolipid hydroxylase (fatty acid hydroxylase superfamily)
MKKQFKTLIKYGLYPTLLFSIFSVIYLAIHNHHDYKTISGVTNLVLVVLLIAIEFTIPLSEDWKMTKGNLWRDFKYILMNVPAIAVANALVGIMAIYYSEKNQGYFSKTPFLVSVIAYLVIFEFFQYWYHRLSHSGKGKMGRLLWKIHLAHHLPDKVYVVMHAVFNPINGFIAALIIQTPILLLGISPETAFAATLFIGLQGIVSHFNVDIRAGFLNYLFIGTETHRYHHSASVDEAKNFGVSLTLWDLVFGTFLYKPNSVPLKLGMERPEEYPKPEDILDVVKFPFVKRAHVNDSKFEISEKV